MNHAIYPVFSMGFEIFSRPYLRPELAFAIHLVEQCPSPCGFPLSIKTKTVSVIQRLYILGLVK